MIVTLAHLRDIEEWIGQGWQVGRLFGWHPVLRAYGKCYVWREAGT